MHARTAATRFCWLALVAAAVAFGPTIRHATAFGRTLEQQSVSATYRLFGLNFSPFLDGQSPNPGTVISEEQIRDRLELVAPYTEWARGFGSTGGLEHTGRIAHELGLKAACSAWLGPNGAANETEIEELISAGLQGHCDLLIVGSEVLLRGDLSEAQLLNYLERVKTALPALQVTTADVYNQLLSHPAIINAVDVVHANYYPYWEGVPLKYAVAALHRAHQQVIAAAGGKQVVVSETGWPSCGNRIGEAVPSVQNASTYFQNFVSWARANAVSYFYFAALDESWKAAYEGPQGACWGVFDEHGVLKSGMRKVFNGKVVADNWSGTKLPGGPGTPTIEFTSVPKYNTFKDLKGRVRHVAPVDHRVAVYIKVAGGWWTKPLYSSPTTAMWPDGTWVCDVTTGGTDQQATEIVAYLIPATYSPPLLGGAATLPPELEANVLAKAEIIRTP